MKIIYSLIVLAIFFSCSGNKSKTKESIPKKNQITVVGYVPDESTAIKVAEAIWLPIYGDLIYEEMPFKASIIKDSVWFVTGTVKSGADGGVVEAEINCRNGDIIRVTHTK